MKRISQRESDFSKELDELLRRNEALEVSCNGTHGYAVGSTVIAKYCLENAPFSCSTQEEVFDASVCLHLPTSAKNKGKQLYNDNKLSFELSEQASSCALFQFLRNTSTFDGQGVCNHELLKKLCAIGYLTVGYKNNRSSKAIVCEGEARTGKSLFASLFKRIAEVFVVDGRGLKKSRYPFSNMRKSTRIVLIEDLQQDYNIEYLFPNITGDWIIAKHNEYDVKLGFSESPKIIITTQASLVGKGASFTDRFLVLKFSNLKKNEEK